MPELKSFKVTVHQVKKTEPILPASIDDAIVYIDNEKSLANMISDLKNVQELAIDTEVNLTK